MRDYRLTEAKVDNDRPPRYYCARYTTNGYHYVQKCNPDPHRNSGVTRQMMLDLLDFLKKGHWIDKQTRLVSITLQVRSNNGGMRSVTRFMFELTQMAAVLPSFDMEAMVDDPESSSKMRVYMLMALGLTAYFIMLEVVEFAQSGLSEYISNVWNVLDWANFLLFFQVFANLIEVDILANRDRERLIWPTDGTPGDCGSVICNQFGFFDIWEVMHTARTAKLFMSVCVCIQLLKIIKFTNVIIPKMSLMTSVLAKGCYDLLFFGIIFAISMFAFCMLFYIQLGSFMDDFYSQPASMIALAKALFGDFPFEEIMDNSRGYVNGILFLIYLFVAVFILLSMFLAILGEAQAAVREAEMMQREEGKADQPYGVLGDAKDWIWSSVKKIRERRRKRKEGAEEEGDGEEEEDEDEDEPLDMALQTALLKMQAKLDSSLKQRMSGLEVRLLKELSRMETKLAESPSPAVCAASSSAKRTSVEKSRRATHAGDGDRSRKCGPSSASPVQLRKASAHASKSSKEEPQKSRASASPAAKRKPSVTNTIDLGVSPPASPRNNLSC